MNVVLLYISKYVYIFKENDIPSFLFHFACILNGSICNSLLVDDY